LSLRLRKGKLRPEQLRPRRGRMTIAIGELFKFGDIAGALVAADTRIVATDLATKIGGKVHLSLTMGKAFAIADAAEDGEAAKMLAVDITSALCDRSVESIGQLDGVVKARMTEWYGAYGQNRPPSMQFVLGAAIGGRCDLFYCSPPNTVLRKTEPFAVGQGARAVDPLLPIPTNFFPTAEAALLRACYWMYRAKRDEGSMCGGATTIFVISQFGKMAIFGDEEIGAAEALGGEIDDLLQQCRYSMLSGSPVSQQQAFLEGFKTHYSALAAKANAVLFPTLKWLEGTTWVRPRKKKAELEAPKEKSPG
jgi:hypothetical protein